MSDKEKVSQWMMDKGYATGHGTSVVDLLQELEWQVAEREREACAKVAEFYEPCCDSCPRGVATAIRARGIDAATVGEVGVWGQVVECEQHKAVTEDGWCEWVCPKPTGYLMQCCDCELVHEVDFRVVKYEPRPSEAFEAVSDTNLQAQMRLRRRDDISPPKREWVGLTEDEVTDCFLDSSEKGILIEEAIEAKLKEKNA